MERNRAVVLVTGASRGIGRAIALRFAREGLQAVLVARDEEKLAVTASEIRQLGAPEPLIVSVDLRDEKQLEKLVPTVLGEFGRIDVLVNNAGVMFLKPITELSLEEFDRMIQVNLRAAFYLTKLVLPQMIERGEGGMIVNISSLAGKNGFKTGTGYCASKWGLRGFAVSLLQEVREYDIRVVTVFPGSVDTGLGKGSPSPTGTPKANKMRPEDIAEAVYQAYRLPERVTVSEIDLRPTNPRKGQ